MPSLPPTVAPLWTPRDDGWLAREPTAFAARKARPLFIGGCPRSGTSLLRTMLDNHPAMAIPRETDFLRPLWWQRAEFGDLSDPANRQRVAEWIFADRSRQARRLLESGVRRRRAIRRIAGAPPTIGSVARAAFRVYAHGHGKKRWGDKRPAYSGFIGPLLELFPNAQYVNVVRDPRGAVASQLPMGWDDPDAALAAATARWIGAVERTDHFARALRPDQLLDVRYEDLVASPRETLARVCRFAGLRRGAALDAALAAERRPDASGIHERLTQPVTTASVERWRERLLPQEVALVERATEPWLARFGYLPSGIEVPPDDADVAELGRQLRHSRREWRRTRIDERVRKLRYRHPVAAVPLRPRG